MQSDILAAVKQIAAERNVDVNEVVEALKEAIAMGFRKDYPQDTEGSALDVDIDLDKGTISVYADKKIVDVVTNEPTQIALSEAKKIEPKLKIGDHVLAEITHTGDFGRVAAQAARQVIMQKIRESEKESLLTQFSAKIGTVDRAVVQRVDREGNVFVDIYRTLAKMPPEEQIENEFYRIGSEVKVYLKKIQKDAKGKIPVVSRNDPNFLRALFEMEVPEIASGTVEIMGIAREAGSRSKVSVKSNASGVDPIGACVGQRGARINAITNELKSGRLEEKIDIIPWSDDTETYLANAIRPAEALKVRIVDADNKQALIIVEDEYVSLAIGREAQNVRLAVKLTGWNLEIQGKKANEENGGVSMFEGEKGVKPAKKAVTKETEAETEVVAEAIPTSAFSDLGLSSRVVSALEKAGVTSIEDLTAKITAEEKIAGVGEKAVADIKAALKL